MRLLPAIAILATATPSYAQQDPCAPPDPCGLAPPPSSYPTASAPRDRPPPDPERDRLTDAKLLHGFRLGYAFVMAHHKPLDQLGGKTLAEKTDMRSPHHFLVGYEAFYRMIGHGWLNVLLVGNVMVAGLEQSQFYPSGNGRIGFEIQNSFQLGTGVNLTPLKGEAAHTIFAAGWTPRVGTFYVPLHAFFIPDVDGVHQIGATTGVTF